MQWVSYLRVSTNKQGISGLGIEAQREAVSAFAVSRHGSIVAEYVEVESGKRNDRPALAEAIAHTKRTGSTLLIAKLDRLARSVSLISSLMEAGVEFQAVDLPDANRFVIHVMAAVAEYERDQISARTKAALAAAKARGIRLGRHSEALAAQAIEEATAYAKSIEMEVRHILGSGVTNLRSLASEMNLRGIRSRQGGTWGPSNCARLLKRLDLTLVGACAAEASPVHN